MTYLLAFPVFGLALILQSSIVARVQLLAGVGDLPLLVVAAWSLRANKPVAFAWAFVAGLATSFVTGLSPIVPIFSYLFVAWLGVTIRALVWQTQLLLMFVVTFAGSLVMYALSYVVLVILGTPLDLAESLQQIVLPSVLLNLLFAIPLNALLRDAAMWLGEAYREDIE
jgi:rod shape-determining protein MreD